ncbi:Universal stress protein A-like protein [Bienertia sinuspersici]
MAESEKSLMIVGIDESDHSFYALEWTLDHFFASGPLKSPFKLLIVYAKPAPTAAIGLTGPGAMDVLSCMESDLKKTAARVIEKAKDLCHSKSIDDVVVKVVEGDARNVLCDAVEKNNASALVLGSHGYGTIKRAVLGSVSDYCAHHANCSVMIIKKPRNKNKN